MHWVEICNVGEEGPHLPLVREFTFEPGAEIRSFNTVVTRPYVKDGLEDGAQLPVRISRSPITSKGVVYHVFIRNHLCIIVFKFLHSANRILDRELVS